MIIGFDLDGTLIDSIPLHIESFIEAGKKMGVEITKSQFLSAQSTTAEDILKHIIPKFTQKQVMEFIVLKDKYVADNIRKIKLFPDTISSLKELGKKAKLVIISNSPYRLVLEFLEHAGLNPLFFDIIIGRDLVQNPKPQPDEIFIAERIEQHNLDYFIGDSIVDIQTGKNAGVKTIAVSTGFNTKEQLAAEKPAYVVARLSEILNII
jgi:HAD superfamily hydrolase (TIGR01549 family)